MQEWLIDMEMDSVKVYTGACAKPNQIFNFNSNHKTTLNFYHWKWCTFMKFQKPKNIYFI